MRMYRYHDSAQTWRPRCEVTVNCEKLANLRIYNQLAFCFGHCIYVHSLSKTNLQLGGHSFLVLSKASGKGKIRGRCRFPGSKKIKNMNGQQSVPGVLMVGTAGRRLLSDLHGFYFSFEVISFYSSFFHISQSLRDIFQTIATPFQQSQLGKV